MAHGSDTIFGGAGTPARLARNAFVGSGQGANDDDAFIAPKPQRNPDIKFLICRRSDEPNGQDARCSTRGLTPPGSPYDAAGKIEFGHRRCPN